MTEAAFERRIAIGGARLCRCRQHGSSGHVVQRSRPRLPALDFYRDDSEANLFGSDVARHFRELAPEREAVAGHLEEAVAAWNACLPVTAARPMAKFG